MRQDSLMKLLLRKGHPSLVALAPGNRFSKNAEWMFWSVMLRRLHQLAGLKVNLQRLNRRLKLYPLTLLLKEPMVFQLVIEAQGVLIRKITSGILRGLMDIGLLVGRTTGGSLEIWRSHRSNRAQSLRHGVSQWSLQSQRLQHLVLGKQQPRWSSPRPSQRPCLIPHHRAG